MTRLKLKVSGADEAMSVLKGMLRVSEQGGADAEEELKHTKEQAKELKEELEHAHATLERALADLEVRLGSNQTLSKTVEAVVRESDRLRRESLDARGQLHGALAELGIKIEENASLADQIKMLIARTGDGEVVRKERDALLERSRILQGTLTKLDEAQHERRAQLEAARAELGTLRGAAAELATMRALLGESQQESQQAAARADAAAADLAEMRRSRGTEGERLEGMQRMVSSMRGVINSAMATLEGGFERLGLSAPAAGDAGPGGQMQGEPAKGGGDEMRRSREIEGDRGGDEMRRSEAFEGGGSLAAAELSLEARVGVLTSHSAALMLALEQTMTELAALRNSHAEIEQHARARCDERCAELQMRLDAMGSGAATLHSQLAYWKAEAGKLRSEMRVCCSKLDAVLVPTILGPRAAFSTPPRAAFRTPTVLGHAHGHRSGGDGDAVADEEGSDPKAVSDLTRSVERAAAKLEQVRADIEGERLACTCSRRRPLLSPHRFVPTWRHPPRRSGQRARPSRRFRASSPPPTGSEAPRWPSSSSRHSMSARPLSRALSSRCAICDRTWSQRSAACVRFRVWRGSVRGRATPLARWFRHRGPSSPHSRGRKRRWER